jgi:hypothetical protein
VNIGVPVAEDLRNQRDRQYATVEFTNQIAVRRALRLDGCILRSSKLVVRLTQVPTSVLSQYSSASGQRQSRRSPRSEGRCREADQQVQKSIRSLLPSTGAFSVSESSVGVISSLTDFDRRRLQCQKTEPVIQGRPPQADKNVFLGLSFAKCVM